MIMAKPNLCNCNAW